MTIQPYKIYKYPKSGVLVYVTEVLNNDFSGYGFDWEDEFLYMAKDWTVGFDGWIEGDTVEWNKKLNSKR